MTIRTTNVAAAAAYDSIKQLANAARNILVQRRAQMLNPTAADVPVSVIQLLRNQIAALPSLAATPGIVAYAQDQEGDASYNITAEVTTTVAAMTASRDQLISMFPKDGNGFLLYQTMDAQGALAYRVFTAAQLLPVIPLLDSVIATIS